MLNVGFFHCDLNRIFNLLFVAWCVSFLLLLDLFSFLGCFKEIPTWVSASQIHVLVSVFPDVLLRSRKTYIVKNIDLVFCMFVTNKLLDLLKKPPTLLECDNNVQVNKSCQKISFIACRLLETIDDITIFFTT